MNIANKLTVLRIVMIPFFMVALYMYEDTMPWIALSLFIVASLTDFLDGYLARKHNLITDFGKFLDPIADKLLVISALVYFSEVGRVAGYLTFIIIAREIIVSGFRIIAANENIVLAASKMGKAKTVTTMLTIIFMLIFKQYVLLESILIYLTVILTIVSGAEYILKNGHIFKGKM